LVDNLPDYARPLFLRLIGNLEMTSSLKPQKQKLLSEGYNPSIIQDPIYFNDPNHQAFVRLDRDLFERICSGEVRV
jgi:fatty-acyl-CoA synthase